LNYTAITVFVLLFGAITVMGFVAARWRRGDLDQLHEWGLGGRRFGTIVTWFLLGGDLYTAYTFIAVPALIFGTGAIGFFALPYTIFIYPILFIMFPKLWAVAHKHNYITAADFVQGRFGNRWLALAIAVTGIIATMPYIALQLVGLEVVIGAMGIRAEGFVGHLPLTIAFVILAVFTYNSGLRAPALIAMVKDTLIWITVIAMITIIPAQLGGYDAIFSNISTDRLLLAAPAEGSLGLYSGYVTLALGSAFALFLYPHSITGILSAKSAMAIQRNAVFLPAYSFLLGLLALTGFMAFYAGVADMPEYAEGFEASGNNFAIPALILHSFPDWFAGVAFAAIGIGGLVPAAIMSIAAANLYTRNIHRTFINPNMTNKQEATNAKIVSLVVKVGALVFILGLQPEYAITLQLLGGIWMSQTFPSVILGLYTRWLNPYALFIGWAAGIALGTWMVSTTGFNSSIYPLDAGVLTVPGYAALYAMIVNLTLTFGLTPILNRIGTTVGTDETVPSDYRYGRTAIGDPNPAMTTAIE
jgi:SSS family solute:Na+ symporter